MTQTLRTCSTCNSSGDTSLGLRGICPHCWGSKTASICTLCSDTGFCPTCSQSRLAGYVKISNSRSPRPFGGSADTWERHAARSKKLYIDRRDQIFDMTGGDRSTIVHNFDDGWSVRRLHTNGDYFYEGVNNEMCVYRYMKGMHPCAKCANTVEMAHNGMDAEFGNHFRIGLLRCQTCQGEGREIHKECKGTGIKKCSYCKGTTYRTCRACNGRGRPPGAPQLCKECGGEGGKAVEYQDKFDPEWTRKRFQTCKSCQGNGSEQCKSCKGNRQKPCGAVKSGPNHVLTCEGCNGSGRTEEKCSHCRRGFTLCDQCQGRGVDSKNPQGLPWADTAFSYNGGVVHSLRDQDNIPYATFTHPSGYGVNPKNAKVNSFKFEHLYGRGNSHLKPEYLRKLLYYAAATEGRGDENVSMEMNYLKPTSIQTVKEWSEKASGPMPEKLYFPANKYNDHKDDSWKRIGYSSLNDLPEDHSKDIFEVATKGWDGKFTPALPQGRYEPLVPGAWEIHPDAARPDNKNVTKLDNEHLATLIKFPEGEEDEEPWSAIVQAPMAPRQSSTLEDQVRNMPEPIFGIGEGDRECVFCHAPETWTSLANPVVDHAESCPWGASLFVHKANILDPIKDSLDPDVFDNPTDDHPQLKPEIAEWVENHVYKALKDGGYPDAQHWTMLILTGSLTTYQWAEHSDFDTSVWINHEVAPEGVDKADMINTLVGRADGAIVPRTTHPIQSYVLNDAEQDIDKIYHPGLRSAWNITEGHWLVPPERNRVRDVTKDFPTFLETAKRWADKFRTVLKYYPEKTIQLWKFLHTKRRKEQLAGWGDFSEGNITYKYLENQGLFEPIAKATGLYIAHVNKSE